jgi:hypothetical protein
MIKVLYNNSYGPGFSFSDAFITEYEYRTGKKLDTMNALFHKGIDSIRCDPVAITLFEEKGAEWCSGEGSFLALREVHPALERYWEIEENEGDEYVRVMITDALADILHTFMLTNDRANLDKQYDAIMNAAGFPQRVGLKETDRDSSNDGIVVDS